MATYIRALTLVTAELQNDQCLLFTDAINCIDRSAAKMLRWFFSKPEENRLPSNSSSMLQHVELRFRTATDLFRRFRQPKLTPFDGKGLTVMRTLRNPESVLVDGSIAIKYGEFLGEMESEGFSHGNSLYDALNMLPSVEHYQRSLAQPEELWKVMCSTLCVDEFRHHQAHDADFKTMLWCRQHKLEANDYRDAVGELRERIEDSAEYLRLESNCRRWKMAVNQLEANRYDDRIRGWSQKLTTTGQDYRRLKEARQCINATSGTDGNKDITLHHEILLHDFENLLVEYEHEHQMAKDALREWQKFAMVKTETMSKLAEVQAALNNIPTSSVSRALEQASCELQNCSTLRLFLNAPDSSEMSSTYIQDLERQQTTLQEAIAEFRAQSDSHNSNVAGGSQQIAKLRRHLFHERHFADIQEMIDFVNASTTQWLDDSQKIVQLEERMQQAEQLIWVQYQEVAHILSFSDILDISCIKSALANNSMAAAGFICFLYELDTIDAQSHRHELAAACLRDLVAAGTLQSLLPSDMNFHYYTVEAYFCHRRSRTSRTLDKRQSFASCDLFRVASDMLAAIDGTTDPQPIGRQCRTVIDAIAEQLIKKQQWWYELHALLQNQPNLEVNRCERLQQLRRLLDSVHDLRQNFDHQFGPLWDHVRGSIAATRQMERFQARHDTLTSLRNQLEQLPTVEQLDGNERTWQSEHERLLQEQTLHERDVYEKLDNLRNVTTALDNLLDALNGAPMQNSLEGMVTIHRSLVELWRGHCQRFRDAIAATKSAIVQQTAATRADHHAALEQIDNLERDGVLLERERDVQCAHLQENTAMLDEFERTNRVTVRARTSQDTSQDRGQRLLTKVVNARRTLDQMQPAYRPVEIERFRIKLSLYGELDRVRSSRRQVTLRNLILPGMERLNVDRLQLAVLMLRSFQSLFGDLGSEPRVTFYYDKESRYRVWPRYPCAEDDISEDVSEDTESHADGTAEPSSFETAKIVGVSIKFLPESEVEEEQPRETELNLAHFLLLLSFLCADGCKMLIMEHEYKTLFNNDGRAMKRALEILSRNAQIFVEYDNQ